jgi:hypothetical protein
MVILADAQEILPHDNNVMGTLCKTYDTEILYMGRDRTKTLQTNNGELLLWGDKYNAMHTVRSRDNHNKAKTPESKDYSTSDFTMRSNDAYSLTLENRID